MVQDKARTIRFAPRIWNTRFLSQAITVKLITVFAFFNPRIEKRPWFMQRFIVLTGCSTNS